MNVKLILISNLPDFKHAKLTTHRIPANRWIKYTNLIAIRNAGVLDYFSFYQIKPDPAKTLTDCIRPRMAALPENAILSWQAGIVRFYVSGWKGTEQKSPCREGTDYLPRSVRLWAPHLSLSANKLSILIRSIDSITTQIYGLFFKISFMPLFRNLQDV